MSKYLHNTERLIPTKDVKKVYSCNSYFEAYLSDILFLSKLKIAQVCCDSTDDGGHIMTVLTKPIPIVISCDIDMCCEQEPGEYVDALLRFYNDAEYPVAILLIHKLDDK